MGVKTAKNNGTGFTVNAYIGDNKTLLAFNFDSQAGAKNLAGFSIQCQPPGETPYYLLNDLAFPPSFKTVPVAGEPANSTAIVPIQKFRWTHVVGSAHQGLTPAVGNYIYTVTPRYFDANQSIKALDKSLGVQVTVPVGPFKTGSLALGFTRGYMQSQAFAHHFGENTPIEPKPTPLQFDTSAQAGSVNGQAVTFEQIYTWMGATARQQIFNILNSVVHDPTLQLDVFAYDLDEPDVLTIFLQLAAQGRIRIILDNAQLHITHVDSKTHKTVVPPEDPFTALFKKQAKAPAAILRGSFDRFSHDKVFIVSKNGVASQVLTGSTNFSITGLYVNANHVLVFNEPSVAAEYAKVFDASWKVLTQFPKTPSAAAANAFSSNPLATQPFKYQSATVPMMNINFSPHTEAYANTLVTGITDRITKEGSAAHGSVFFAVMQINNSDTPVYNTLNQIHANTSFVSYGISDGPKGTFLYSPGSKTGILVSAKPGTTNLPKPFNQVKIPPGHEIHDKFVVCGLNGPDPVVYAGSSNLALLGEQQNGDNLLEIHDPDVAAAFAIEALLLVDHYQFLDHYASPKKPKAPKKSTAPKKPAAKKAPAK
jgi:phosphatidylserine/phosphatidylglycerophosphate/cardiolipin synthase-like enzyme